MPIDLDSIASTLGSNATKMEQNLSQILSNVDASKPQDMIKMQSAMQKYSMAMQLQSTVMNNVGECIKGIIQKMA
jgi:type III secretion apparatus needle protein